ncbi:MAG TPA: RnfH family protein [Azospirillaceae bacterium]|nr:RnfH family protein [Azospirillaceae bacterium]
MKIGVVYALSQRQTWLTTEVPEGATVRQAIERSGILGQFPDIDLTRQRVGIYGKFASLDAVVEDGARIEIYRSIIADPATVRRRGQQN